MKLPDGKQVLERNGTEFFVTLALSTGQHVDYWLTTCLTCGADVTLFNQISGDSSLLRHGTWHQGRES